MRPDDMSKTSENGTLTRLGLRACRLSGNEGGWPIYWTGARNPALD